MNQGSGKEDKGRQDSSHKSRRIQEVKRDGNRSRKGRGQLKAKGYNLCQEGPDVDRGGGWRGKWHTTWGKENDSSACGVESGVRG